MSLHYKVFKVGDTICLTKRQHINFLVINKSKDRKSKLFKYQLKYCYCDREIKCYDPWNYTLVISRRVPSKFEIKLRILANRVFGLPKHFYRKYFKKVIKSNDKN